MAAICVLRNILKFQQSSNYYTNLRKCWLSVAAVTIDKNNFDIRCNKKIQKKSTKKQYACSYSTSNFISFNKFYDKKYYLVPNLVLLSVNNNSRIFLINYNRIQSIFNINLRYLSSDVNKFGQKLDNKDSLKTSTIEEFRIREEIKERELSAVDSYPSNNNAGTKPNDIDPNDEKMKAIRLKILDASLQHVPVNGWSRESITKGAESIGYPGVVHSLFPDSAMDLIQHFYAGCNQKLVEQMKQETGGAPSIPEPMDFVKKCIRTRLTMLIPVLKQWPQASGIMSLPQNAPRGLANLLTLIDDICYYAGDRSVDFNWYGRRVALATIYKMTELYMIQDKSVDYQRTWTFLDRRIEDAVHLYAVLAQTETTTTHMQRAINTAFTTARNLLGLNFDRK